MSEYTFGTLRWSVLFTIVIQCWALDIWSKQTSCLSFPKYTISDARRWGCQNSQIICFSNKISKYPEMLKLKLPQALLPHITSTFGKAPLTLAAYSNMAEQFLSNFSNELGTNRHVSLGTHAVFSIFSFSLKINNFSKLLCKESHSKQYVLVNYWLMFGMWNYLARCFANSTELGSDQRPVSQMHLSLLTFILITELS